MKEQSSILTTPKQKIEVPNNDLVGVKKSEKKQEEKTDQQEVVEKPKVSEEEKIEIQKEAVKIINQDLNFFYN